jgi:hypothetical protein
MNWTAWNSLVANALRKRPRATPSSAFATASATTRAGEPWTVTPSRPKATADVMAVWIVATSANATA